MNQDALTSEVQEGLEALESYVREASAQLVFDEDLIVIGGSMPEVVGLHMSEIPGVTEAFDSDLEFVRAYGDAITGFTRFWRWRVWAVTVSPTDDGGIELQCRCILAIDPAQAGLSLCHLVDLAARAATALGVNGAD